MFLNSGSELHTGQLKSLVVGAAGLTLNGSLHIGQTLLFSMS